MEIGIPAGRWSTGRIPSDLATGTTAEIEEERRLLYVAMTRARDQLHLVVPQRFYVHGQAAKGDRHVYASRTRFIPGRPPRPLRAVHMAHGHADRTRWTPSPAGGAGGYRRADADDVVVSG